jgi:hypothetical protein
MILYNCYIPLYQMSSTNYEYSNMNVKTLTRNSDSILSPVFILCETCHWCATYFDKNRLLPQVDDYNNKCPECCSVGALSSFPISSNESFTFNYTHKRGVELEFRIRRDIKKRNKR